MRSGAPGRLGAPNYTMKNYTGILRNWYLVDGPTDDGIITTRNSTYLLDTETPCVL